ncbi:hypothetical protein [Acinetobacter phage vB_AbaP_HB01]|nr:hypothetical protein [Acinetobacter phage vB_AbaP_HB01]
MSNIIKAEAFELGNFILMCYQDVLKAMKDIELGVGQPWWFNMEAGSCVNLYNAAESLYGVKSKTFDKAQRLCLVDFQTMVNGESKLDYVLTQLWLNHVRYSKEGLEYINKTPSRVYPIKSEFDNQESWDSYHLSSKNLTLYKGKQLEARVHLVKFKCDALSNELKSIWKSGVTSKDFKTVLEELENLEG